MGGRVSKMIEETRDSTEKRDGLFDKLQVADFLSHEGSKKQLHQNLLDSSVRCARAKKSYGNGVSIMGHVSMLAARHTLRRVDYDRYSGKDWTDKNCLRPPMSVNHLGCGPFFHAKRDGAGIGPSCGMIYRVHRSKNSARGEEGGFLNVWVVFCVCAPYANGKPVFTYVYACTSESSAREQLASGMKHVYDQKESIADGETEKLKALVLDYFKVTAFKDDCSTCTVIFSCIGDKVGDTVTEQDPQEI